MRVFVWTIVILMLIECIGRIVWLSIGHVPTRTTGTMAADCVIAIALSVWGIWTLAQ